MRAASTAGRSGCALSRLRQRGPRLGQLAPGVLDFLLRGDAALDQRRQPRDRRLRVLDARLRLLDFGALAPRRRSSSDGISKRTSRSPGSTRSPFGLRQLDDARRLRAP